MNDGLGEGIHGLAQALGRAFVPVEAALKVIIFGLAIGCMVKSTGPSCWPGFCACLGVSKAGAEDPSREQQRQERKGKNHLPPWRRPGRQRRFSPSFFSPPPVSLWNCFGKTHGRNPAVATALDRLNEDRIVGRIS
jgi:hypothetical protein